MAEPQDVALGAADADLAVRNGTVALLERDEFREADVLVADGRIAAVTPDAGDAIGPETTVIDAADQWVVPGFVDAHTHADLHQTVENAQHRILESGTTTMVADLEDAGPRFGRTAVEAFLEATADLAVDVRLTVTAQPFVETFEPSGLSATDREELIDALGDERVIGVGETEWIHVLGRDLPGLRAMHSRARSEGKRLVGHGAGCRGEKLTAFASIVDNDHESTSARDVFDRLDRGLHVVGRYGSVRDDLDAVAGAWPAASSHELSLSTDGMWPRDLVEKGYMDAVVRETIDRGVDPLDAIRMATRSPARHFGLSDRGSIAPGKRATMVVLDDLASVTVDAVVVDGDPVVADGEALDRVAPQSASYPDAMYEPIAAEITPDLAVVPADATAGDRVRAISHEGGLLTSETTVEPRREGGQFHAAPDRDVCKAVIVDAHPKADRGSFAGFVTGLGIERGAVATSVTWEASGVMGIGADDGSVLAAMERVTDVGGGWAVVADGSVLAEFRTPIAGLCADTPVETTAAAYGRLEGALADIGMSQESPTIPVQTLTSPGVPRLRMSYSGYADVVAREVVGLDPDADA